MLSALLLSVFLSSLFALLKKSLTRRWLHTRYTRRQWGRRRRRGRRRRGRGVRRPHTLRKNEERKKKMCFCVRLFNQPLPPIHTHVCAVNKVCACKHMWTMHANTRTNTHPRRIYVCALEYISWAPLSTLISPILLSTSWSLRSEVHCSSVRLLTSIARVHFSFPHLSASLTPSLSLSPIHIIIISVQTCFGLREWWTGFCHSSKFLDI